MTPSRVQPGRRSPLVGTLPFRLQGHAETEAPTAQEAFKCAYGGVPGSQGVHWRSPTTMGAALNVRPGPKSAYPHRRKLITSTANCFLQNFQMAMDGSCEPHAPTFREGLFGSHYARLDCTGGSCTRGKGKGKRAPSSVHGVQVVYEDHAVLPGPQCGAAAVEFEHGTRPQNARRTRDVPVK